MSSLNRPACLPIIICHMQLVICILITRIVYRCTEEYTYAKDVEDPPHMENTIWEDTKKEQSQEVSLIGTMKVYT